MEHTATILARRYALAFINSFKTELSEQESTKLLQASDALRTMHAALAIISYIPLEHEKKTELIAQQLAKFALNTQPYKKLISLLLEDKRLMLLPLVLSAIVALYKEQQGIASFIITSAQPLQEDKLVTIAHFLQTHVKRSIEFTTELDPSLIAGIRLKSDSWLWEDSLDKKLRSIQVSYS